MKTHVLEFHNEDRGELIKMTVGAGDPDLNEFYRAAAMNYVHPRALAMQLGRVSEEDMTEIQMRAYACGVVISTEPEMDEQEVFEWFKNNPKEFGILFEIADCRENFEEDGDSDEHGAHAAPVGSGSEGSG